MASLHRYSSVLAELPVGKLPASDALAIGAGRPCGGHPVRLGQRVGHAGEQVIQRDAELTDTDGADNGNQTHEYAILHNCGGVFFR